VQAEETNPMEVASDAADVSGIDIQLETSCVSCHSR
jgi:cbb3-type cytochrome oxidase cytochrome c subunit